MRPGPGRLAIPAMLLLSMHAVALRASLTTCERHPAAAAPIADQAEERPRIAPPDTVARDSLRRDVAAHPGDFLAFETEASAFRFIAAHGPEAQREADPRIIARGVLGYWREKTVVVLPSLAALLG